MHFFDRERTIREFNGKDTVPDEDPPAGVEEHQEAEEARMAADDSLIAKPEIEIVNVEEDPSEV